MGRLTTILVVLAISAGAVSWLDGVTSAPGAPEPKTERDSSADMQAYAARGREVRLAAAADGHFYAEAEINGRAMRFLVDTGASAAALRASDARRAGIRVSPSDFSVPVQTANGVGHAARVTLSRVEIDGVAARDVTAFVLPDEALSVNLLGMTFLSRLDRFEAKNGELLLAAK